MNDSDKTKEQLLEELELLRLLMDNLPDRLYVKDKEGRFVVCNKAVAEDADLPFSGEVVGRSDFDLFPAEKAKEYYATEQEIMKTGRPLVNAELCRRLRKDGRTNWSLCTKLPWRNSAGEIIGIIGANRDITERKTAEQALQESEARYKAIFESAREGILVADAQTKAFIYTNPAVCKMFGYSKEELVRMSVPDIHPKESLPQVLAEFESMGHGERGISHNLACLRRDGTIFYAEINATTVVIDNRPCLVGFFTDTTQSKHVEEQLRESEQKYRLLIEQLPAITYTAALDEASTTTYVSPQTEEILGILPADYKADPDLWLKLLHPDDRRQVLAELKESHKTGKSFSCEYRMVAKDGRIVWVHDDARIVRDDKGKPLHLQGVMYDITAHRKTEEALRQSEEKFRGLAERSFDMVFMTDARGLITYLSPASKRIFDFQPEEMVGKHFANFLKKSEIPKVRKRFTENLHGRKLDNLLLEAKKKDGSRVFIELAFSLIMQDGVIQGTQGIIRNVTDRKKAEEELQRAHDEMELRVRQRTADLAQAVEELQKEISERKQAEESLRNAEHRFRTIFENTIVGLYRTTPDGRILMANPALVKMLGYKSFGELAKVNLEKKGLDPSTPRSVFKKQIKKKGKVIGLESIWTRRDGSRLYVSESAFAAKDSNGDILYYEGTAQDISKRKEAEEKLLHYQEQLRLLASQQSLADEQLRRRIATELHDHISQDLAISKMKLESLTDPAKSDLNASLKEVIGLIAHTIDASRSLTFEMSPPVLYELGFEAAIGWLVGQTRKRFHINAEFTDDGKPKPLNTEVRVMLFHAVRELLVNVVKHAKARIVKVSASQVRGHIQITVEDDGIGFDASRKTGGGRVSHKSGSGDYTSGFGLFNIRERLNYIGGKVNIRSKPGKGTRVTLIAPLNIKTKRLRGVKK